MKRVLPTYQGMSISLRPPSQILLCCWRMPVMHSLAALIQAIHLHLTLQTQMHFYHFIDMLGLSFFQVWSFQSIFSSPSQRCQQQLFLIRLLKSERCGQTHLLAPVGPPVQEGAECLSSCLGLWGRLGQWVYAEAGQERREKSFLTTANWNAQILIISSSAVNQLITKANY